MSVVTPKTRSFSFQQRVLPRSGILYIVDVKSISASLRSFMDESLGKLVYGRTKMDIKLVKQKIRDFLASKKDSTQEIGAIAEYFVHLFLHDLGLQSQFLIKNLEDNSLKKGFDGLYIDNEKEWICESKSGSAQTDKVGHGAKVKEAYNGIKKKISGKEPNNPWENAMYHAKLVKAEQTLVEKLEQLSDQFDNKEFSTIDSFNLIPCGTIYLDGIKKEATVDEIEEEINNLITSFKCKGLRVVCVTKETVNAFHTYLNT
jgi:hypothetical protein